MCEQLKEEYKFKLYVKRPLVISAVRFDGSEKMIDYFTTLDPNVFQGSYNYITLKIELSIKQYLDGGFIKISEGDYVIKNNKGYSCCKSDCFHHTYYEDPSLISQDGFIGTRFNTIC